MTLWTLVIPGFLLIVTAIAAHVRWASYWPAVEGTFLASVAWLLPYFVALQIVFVGPAPLEWTDLFRSVLTAVVGAGIGAVISMIVGVVFVADRRIAQGSDADDHTE